MVLVSSAFVLFEAVVVLDFLLSVEVVLTVPPGALGELE